MNNSISAMLSAAVLGMFGGIAATPDAKTTTEAKTGNEVNNTKNTPSKANSFERQMNAMLGGSGISRSNRRNPGPGWSNRQVQRMARKKRAVKANRSNHKG